MATLHDAELDRLRHQFLDVLRIGGPSPEGAWIRVAAIVAAARTYLARKYPRDLESFLGVAAEPRWIAVEPRPLNPLLGIVATAEHQRRAELQRAENVRKLQTTIQAIVTVLTSIDKYSAAEQLRTPVRKTPAIPEFRIDLSQAVRSLAAWSERTKESRRLTLPFGVFGLSAHDQDIDIARRSLLRLADKRVLTTKECCDDCINRSLQSILEIRQTLIERQEDLVSRPGGAVFLLHELLLDGVRAFLTWHERLEAAFALNGHPAEESRRDPIARDAYFHALAGLRAHMGSCLQQLSELADFPLRQSLENQWPTDAYSSNTGLEEFVAAVSRWERTWAAGPPASLEEARGRVMYLKDMIENKGGHRIFYKEGGLVRDESDIQIMYRLTWCGTGFDISREVNDGRGPVDFKVSIGSLDKALVEFKLARSSSLRRNLERQTAIYERASDAQRSLKVITYFTDAERLKVEQVLADLDLDEPDDVILIDADATNKPSGSVA